MAVDWSSVAMWAVGLFIVVTVLILAVVVLVAMLTGNGFSQEREPS